MIETWRWFGPSDSISLNDIRQAGASGIVTALYDIPPGQVWPAADIAQRQSEVTTPSGAPLHWAVVESLPVSEAIKTGSSERDRHIENWIASLHNLAAAGIDVICYNFMPVLDWTRTDLAFPRPSGARALRFDLVDFAAFDIHILARADADASYDATTVAAAATRINTLSKNEGERLTTTILAGLPGAMDGWTLDSFRAQLDRYRGIDARALRANLAYFLTAVVPEAERLGLRLCAHPDDPPWSLFGLPRILSTEADYTNLIAACPSPANGITLCTGSLGARPDVDLPGMIDRMGPQIHFLHLRNVRRETAGHPGSFFEDDHLAGSTDMVAVIDAVLREEARRSAEERSDAQIPMRPDHGQQLLDDFARVSAPGYPAIGRLRGLAELRGVAAALVRQ